MATHDDVINTILAEAGGGGRAGMDAVAHVIANRADQWGLTPEQVVAQPHQFEAYSNPSPGGLANQRDPNLRALAEQVWQNVATGLSPDPTNGGLNYYGDYINPPVWAQSAPHGTVNIGGNVFVKGSGAPGGPAIAYANDTPAPHNDATAAIADLLLGRAAAPKPPPLALGPSYPGSDVASVAGVPKVDPGIIPTLDTLGGVPFDAGYHPEYASPYQNNNSLNPPTWGDIVAFRDTPTASPPARRDGTLPDLSGLGNVLSSVGREYATAIANASRTTAANAGAALGGVGSALANELPRAIEARVRQMPLFTALRTAQDLRNGARTFENSGVPDAMGYAAGGTNAALNAIGDWAGNLGAHAIPATQSPSHDSGGPFDSGSLYNLTTPAADLFGIGSGVGIPRAAVPTIEKQVKVRVPFNTPIDTQGLSWDPNAAYGLGAPVLPANFDAPAKAPPQYHTVTQTVRVPAPAPPQPQMAGGWNYLPDGNGGYKNVGLATSKATPAQAYDALNARSTAQGMGANGTPGLEHFARWNSDGGGYGSNGGSLV